jgi:hypothetical protein
MSENEKMMDNLVREMSLDEKDNTTVPNKEARKWMAARSHILNENGSLVSSCYFISPLLFFRTNMPNSNR